MSDGAEVMRFVDALMALPKPEPAAVARALGVPLVLTAQRHNYEDYGGVFTGGPFSEVKSGHHPGTDYGLVELSARHLLPKSALDLSGFEAFPELGIQSPSAADPSVSHKYKARGDTLEIIFVYDHAVSVLRSVVLRWGPVKYRPGEEPVFATAPPLLYLRSYDTVKEVLEYAVKTREWRVLTREEATALGVALRRGAFAREGNQVAGYFTTPEGPAFFHNKKRFLGAFGKVSSRIELIAKTTRKRYTLSIAGSTVIDLVYEQRHGVGTNPYDTEEEDVDLFALIAARVSDKTFFNNTTQRWP
jgi:hypothetical protein